MALLLGKLDPVRPDMGYLAYYAATVLPAPPDSVAPPAVNPWRMFLNDQLGCCVMACAAHLDMAWNLDVKESDAIPTDPELRKEYFALTGGRDSGLPESTTLNHWFRKGLFGYKIGAYAPVPHTDINAIKQSIAFYGGCFLGVQLPASAQQQFVPGGKSIWSVVPGSPIEGGHAIAAVGYDANGIYIISWGQVVLCTYEWIAKYLDESYAALSNQFIQAGKGPLLDLVSLKADIRKL